LLFYYHMNVIDKADQWFLHKAIRRIVIENQRVCDVAKLVEHCCFTQNKIQFCPFVILKLLLFSNYRYIMLHYHIVLCFYVLVTKYHVYSFLVFESCWYYSATIAT